MPSVPPSKKKPNSGKSKAAPARVPVEPAKGMTAAVRIKEARDALGDSTASLARRLSSDDAYSARQRLSTYLTGRSEPGLSAAEQIAKAIGLPAPYFFATDPDVAAYLLSYPGKSWRKKLKAIDLDQWASEQRAKLPSVNTVRSPRRLRS